jgi:hypothetical protein
VSELVRDPQTPWLTTKHGARRPTLLYPLAKWSRLVARAARSSPATLGWSLLLAPWIVAAHAAWLRGYLSEAASAHDGHPARGGAVGDVVSGHVDEAPR